MPEREMYRNYRRRIEELADERRSAEHSLGALRALLQEFERNAAELGSATAGIVCDELANQLEHEALRSVAKHRRDVLLAAVKAFDDMKFSNSKT